MFRRRLLKQHTWLRCPPLAYLYGGSSSLTVCSFSSSSSSNSSGGSCSSTYSATGPSEQQSTSWERGAKRVQHTTIENNQYLEHIRDVHDPSQHLKTIEEELMGTIGQALGKQGEKIMVYRRLMEQERHRYEDLAKNLKESRKDLKDDSNSMDDDDQLLQEYAISHNNYRKECLHARWELIVHRQAAGFIVENHKFVMKNYPIGDMLPVTTNIGTSSCESDTTLHNNDSSKTKKKKIFTDQLDWWAQIGRWK